MHLLTISVETTIQIHCGQSNTCNMGAKSSNLNGNSKHKCFALKIFVLIIKVVPTIAFYYFNRVTEAMKGRSTSTSRQNKRSSTSDKSDSAPSSDKDEQDSRGSKDEGESPNDAKRRRRLIEEDNHDSRDSAPPSSPDHTYKTSDDEENSDKERECDKELNNMLPCTGTEELLSSDNDDENNVDDDVDDDFVAPGKGVQTLSRPGLNLEGLVRVRASENANLGIVHIFL